MRVEATCGGPKGVGARLSFAVVALVALSVLAVLVGPPPVRAANALEAPTVTPGSGTTATVFELSVVYSSTAPALPTRVWADIPGGTVELATSDAVPPATYRGGTTLPAGTHDIVFHASVQGSQPPEVQVTVTVQQAPASATPAPTPVPTSAPTPTPLPPSPAPTVAPPATPDPPPAPPVQPTPPPPPAPVPPGVTPAPPTEGPPLPSASVSPSTPGPSPSAEGSLQASPWAPVTERPAGGSADPSADASPADDDPPRRGGLVQATLVAIGSTTAVAGAAILVRNWRGHRRPRASRAGATTPVRYPPRR